MKKVYTLSTCDSSRRILKQINITELEFEIKDIKTSSVTAIELEEMHGFKRCEIKRSRLLKAHSTRIHFFKTAYNY
jgi:arsenate reductase